MARNCRVAEAMDFLEQYLLLADRFTDRTVQRMAQQLFERGHVAAAEEYARARHGVDYSLLRRSLCVSLVQQFKQASGGAPLEASTYRFWIRAVASAGDYEVGERVMHGCDGAW